MKQKKKTKRRTSRLLEKHSTTDNVFILYTLITKYFRHKGGRFYARFVDFENAFDRVDRSAFWHKLLTQNISSKMVKMLEDIYADVKTCIKTPMGLTDYLYCLFGVRQGCIISPVMFTLFLNDLQEYVSLDSHGIDIEAITLFVLLFADDLVIFAETVIELQRMINRLGSYCNLWRLVVNLVIVFRNGGPLRNYETWKFGDSVLEVVSSYKYLGILFSSRNSWFVCKKKNWLSRLRRRCMLSNLNFHDLETSTPVSYLRFLIVNKYRSFCTGLKSGLAIHHRKEKKSIINFVSMSYPYPFMQPMHLFAVN